MLSNFFQVAVVFYKYSLMVKLMLEEIDFFSTFIFIHLIINIKIVNFICAFFVTEQICLFCRKLIVIVDFFRSLKFVSCLYHMHIFFVVVINVETEIGRKVLSCNMPKRSHYF